MPGGLGGALSGLSAMYGGYKQGEMDEYKLDDLKRSELAKVAMGNALKMLGGGMGQAPGGPAGMLPGGQPQQPMPPQGPPSPAGGVAPPGPGGMPPRPGGVSPGGPAPAVGGPAPQQMQGPGMVPGGMPAQGGPPRVNPQGGMPGQGQQLDWRQLVQAVQQSNPNLPPDVLAEAVNQFLPMMTAQSQQEWRMVSLQLREQALQSREQQFMLAEQGRNERTDKTIAGRENVAEIGAASREQAAATGAESREKVAGQKLDQQERQFQQREARLEQSLKLREDSTWARLDQQKEAARQRVEASQGRQGLAEFHAIINAQDKHVRTRIMAMSSNNTMTPEERKKMLAQADKEYNDQIEMLRNQYGGKKGAAPAGTKPQTSSGPNPDAVVIVHTPEEAQKLAPGTRYKNPNGDEFTR